MPLPMMPASVLPLALEQSMTMMTMMGMATVA
jgi:hypothetical protein